MLHATLQVLSHIQPLEPDRVFLMNVPRGSCCLGQDLLVFIKVMASSSVISWRIPQVMQLNNDIARNSRLGWMLTVWDIPSAPPEHGNLSSLLVINIRECVKVNIFSNAVFLFFFTLSLASCISCQTCSSLFSPCALKEQNSPSETVPENK